MPPFKWLANVAALCRDVYQHTPISVTMGVTGIHDIRHGSDYGCAYVTDGTIYIAVRGSDDWADWKSNFKLLGRDNWYGIAVHKGFGHAARGMQGRVLDLIGLHPGKRVVFCGHSRGGAIALLLAIAAEQHFPATVVQCVTFGQPRVSTGEAIRERFFGEYIRVQNGSDAVCRWPKIGFGHAGTCVYLPNRGDKPYLIDPGFIELLRDQFLTGTQRRSDHSIQAYTEELMQCVPSA